MTTTDKSHKYALLHEEEDTIDKAYSFGDRSESWHMKKGRDKSLVILFALSLILNIFMLIWCLCLSYNNSTVPERTRYAYLTQDSAVPWTSKNPYFGENETAADLLWEDINIDNGTVALEDSYVEALGLPTSQRFPWDERKGIYILNGFHSMHCLKTIREAVLEFDRSLERKEPTEHILHCLDALRQDILCYADDTPRYTGFQEPGRSGTGQIRQCRNWSQLEVWAQKNTACWRYINPHDHTFNSLERYKFCPEASPYSERAKQESDGLRSDLGVTR